MPLTRPQPLNQPRVIAPDLGLLTPKPFLRPSAGTATPSFNFFNLGGSGGPGPARNFQNGPGGGFLTLDSKEQSQSESVTVANSLTNTMTSISFNLSGSSRSSQNVSSLSKNGNLTNLTMSDTAAAAFNHISKDTVAAAVQNNRLFDKFHCNKTVGFGSSMDNKAGSRMGSKISVGLNVQNSMANALNPNANQMNQIPVTTSSDLAVTVPLQRHISKGLSSYSTYNYAPGSRARSPVNKRKRSNSPRKLKEARSPSNSLKLRNSTPLGSMRGTRNGNQFQNSSNCIHIHNNNSRYLHTGNNTSIVSAVTPTSPKSASGKKRTGSSAKSRSVSRNRASSRNRTSPKKGMTRQNSTATVNGGNSISVSQCQNNCTSPKSNSKRKANLNTGINYNSSNKKKTPKKNYSGSTNTPGSRKKSRSRVKAGFAETAAVSGAVANEPNNNLSKIPVSSEAVTTTTTSSSSRAVTVSSPKLSNFPEFTVTDVTKFVRGSVLTPSSVSALGATRIDENPRTTTTQLVNLNETINNNESSSTTDSVNVTAQTPNILSNSNPENSNSVSVNRYRPSSLLLPGRSCNNMSTTSNTRELKSLNYNMSQTARSKETTVTAGVTVNKSSALIVNSNTVDTVTTTDSVTIKSNPEKFSSSTVILTSPAGPGNAKNQIKKSFHSNHSRVITNKPIEVSEVPELDVVVGPGPGERSDLNELPKSTTVTSTSDSPNKLLTNLSDEIDGAELPAPYYSPIECSTQTDPDPGSKLNTMSLMNLKFFDGSHSAAPPEDLDNDSENDDDIIDTQIIAGGKLKAANHLNLKGISTLSSNLL